MTINVTFGSMDEMRDFARAFLSDDAAPAVQQAASVPVATPTPQAPTEQAPAQQAKHAAVQAPVQQPTPANASMQAVPTQAPTQQAVPTQAPTQQAVPTSQPTYAMDDLSRAAMTLMDTGRQDELRNLLAQFGVQSLPDLPQEQYGAFATALRGMGAKI